MRIALKETGARGAVHPVRIETASELITTCDAVSARALADLDLLLNIFILGRRIIPISRLILIKAGIMILKCRKRMVAGSLI